MCQSCGDAAGVVGDDIQVSESPSGGIFAIDCFLRWQHRDAMIMLVGQIDGLNFRHGEERAQSSDEEMEAYMAKPTEGRFPTAFAPTQISRYRYSHRSEWTRCVWTGAAFGGKRIETNITSIIPDAAKHALMITCATPAEVWALKSSDDVSMHLLDAR